MLASQHEVSWNTIDNRFVAFKDKELKKEVALAHKFTENGIHSLFWLVTKKVAKLTLDTSNLATEQQDAVTEANIKVLINFTLTFSIMYLILKGCIPYEERDAGFFDYYIASVASSIYAYHTYSFTIVL
ncbi:MULTISPECIES: hypothetical protein [unclassified Legionella]|uniref:hypothetical protein n=1 Tax=unclassified Legionella TaxID=2622702 RepID=UPI001056730A|nr:MULTISPECIES: hypothetical protein [unclassified Legionella]MDI9819705.1 hypothetical protein [Legionella sp. PL877]